MSLPDWIAGLPFLRPAWLLALPVVLLPWLSRRWRGVADSPWAGIVDPALLPSLLAGTAAGARTENGWIPSGFLALVVLALAGPSFRSEVLPEARHERGWVVALDLSASMLARDVSPSRLQRARFEILDLLRRQGDAQVALVAFAGDAFTVAPLTDDARTLENLLLALSPEVMPVEGRAPARALELAARLLEQAGMDGGEVLLVSHGGDPAAEPVAARLRERGLRTSVLVVGSEEGAPVPRTGGGFQADAEGRPLLTRRDLDGAARLAAAGGGLALAATADDADIRRLVALWEAGNGRWQLREAGQGARRVDDGPWLALLALLPALWMLRHQAGLGLLLLALLAGSDPAHAGPVGWRDRWESWWLRPDQQAWRALEEGDAERAAALATTPELKGAAAYRSGDYAAAATAFAAQDSADAHYNRGTALARAGRLREALEALDRALALDPEHADARHNREVVARALAEQEASRRDQGEPPPAAGETGRKPEPESGASPGETGDEAGDPTSVDAPSREGQDREGGEEGDAPAAATLPQDQDQGGDPSAEKAVGEAVDRARQEAGEGQPPDAQPASPAAAEKTPPQGEPQSEWEQASEQLLRRLADDPGALLRRKFAIEYRRRQLQRQQEERP